MADDFYAGRTAAGTLAFDLETYLACQEVFFQVVLPQKRVFGPD